MKSKQIAMPVIEANRTKEFIYIAAPVIDVVFNNRGYSSTSKIIWSFIYRHARKNENLQCQFSLDFIAKNTGFSVRTVSRRVNELEKNSLLHIERSYKKVSVYTIMLSDEMASKVKQFPNRKSGKKLNKENKTMEETLNLSSPSRIDKLVSQLNNRFININNNNNNIDNSIYIKEDNLMHAADVSVPVVVSNNFLYEEVSGCDSNTPSMHSEIRSIVSEKIEQHVEKASYFKEFLNKKITEIDQSLQKKVAISFKAKSDLNSIKNEKDPNIDILVELSTREKIASQEVDLHLAAKSHIKNIAKNSSALYLMASIKWMIEQRKSCLRKQQELSLSDPRRDGYIYYLESLNESIEKLVFNAKKAILLGNIYYCGHDLNLSAPKIPKNILENTFSKVKEIVGSVNSLEIFNEIVTSVRFGELSRVFVDGEGLKYLKGFNVALKLLREGKWRTPKCVDIIDKSIFDSDIVLKPGYNDDHVVFKVAGVFEILF